LSGPNIAEKMVTIIQVNRNQIDSTLFGTIFLLNTNAAGKKQTNTNGNIQTSNNRKD